MTKPVLPQSVLGVTKIETAIKRAQAILLKRAKKNGLCENFGQTEVDAIEAQFITLGDFSDTMLKRRTQIKNLRAWCANLDLEAVAAA